MRSLGLRQRASGLPETPSPIISNCRTELNAKAQALDPCPPLLLGHGVVAIGESRCGMQGQSTGHVKLLWAAHYGAQGTGTLPCLSLSRVQLRPDQKQLAY